MDGLINYKLYGITLQQIQIFCIAAKCENLTETAKYMHMAQATVSKNISTLENNLGLLLFLREKKRITLTSAGKQLAQDWRGVLNTITNSVGQARKTHEGAPTSLFIADYYATNSAKYLTPFVEQFEGLNPEIDLIVERTDPYSIFTGLKERYYDAAFFSSDGEAMLKNADLDYMQLFSLCPVIAYSNSHRLAKKDPLFTSDFIDETIVAMTDDRYKFYWEMVETVYQKCGFQSDIKYVSNEQTMAFELTRGRSVAIIDETYMPFSGTGIRFHQLPECDKILGFGLAWSPDNENPLLKKMLEFARTTFGPWVAKQF